MGGKAGGGRTSFGTNLMKNKGAKQKLKRKGATSAFGCDLTEHLESSGQDGKHLFILTLVADE